MCLPRDGRLDITVAISESNNSSLPAHKVPRRSEQVSHEKDMFRLKYRTEIPPSFRREH